MVAYHFQQMFPNFILILGCPEGMDPDRMIPESMKKYLKCSLADNCFGLSCCLQFSFTIPLSSLERHLSVPFWFEMDPCELSFFTGIGTYQHHERLLHYNWGKIHYILNLHISSHAVHIAINDLQ